MKMTFKDVSDAFQVIETTNSRLEITRQLAQLFRSAHSNEAAIIANLSLGVLHPPYIGTQFKLAQKSMVGIVADLLGTDTQSVQTGVHSLGDIGLVVEQGEWKHKGELTINDVYEALIKIERMSGSGSQEEKASALTQLLHKVDPICAKFIVRIVLGKLRLGFSDMTIIDALSWMEVGDKSIRTEIEHAYNLCADIGLIAKTIKKEGIEGICKMKIQLGIPIRPAAAERLPSPQAIIEKIGPCVAQPKLDGFRLQIHIDNSGKKTNIHFFSRNLQDMSAMFPDLVATLTTLKVKNLIAEGEAIAYDPDTQRFLPFQETVKRKRKHGIEAAIEEFPLRLFLFDILYLNGKSLLALPHAERRNLLLDTMKSYKGSLVQVDDEKEITTAEQLERYFLQMLEDGLEGLVVKRPYAIYQPGKRNFNWIKLKRHEKGELGDTLDCVILGYYQGSGKRAAFGIGALLVGVYDKKNDSFTTVAKIGTGMSDAQWKEAKNKCDAIAVSRKPNNVTCPKELYPTVWTAPELVCMIRADEITKSPTHSTGFALRFPRFMGYRPDKSPLEATTVAEIKRMHEDQYV